ncbi:SCO family protein [Kitasatospora sp. NPDC052896]|uniref:SCO family protein n=1 Tax=Kitasatospora sp. NPDC052896 TaxID=3364061 RepID=UPI0037C7721C
MTSRRRPAVAAALALTAALALSACSSANANNSGSAVVQQQAVKSPYEGTPLTNPFTKPDLVLPDTSGQPFDLRQRTDGVTTLLFFGYTDCPDVCPTTMGDIGVAMQKLPPDEQKKIDVVFVSTDPARDTPTVLRTWLDSFDKNFIGLTGNLDEVKAAAKSLGILVEDPVVNKDGTVTSSHGAQVLAFLPSDNKAHVLYLSNSTIDVFSHDLPLLAKGVPAT